MTTTAVHPFTGSFTADPDHSSFQAQLRHMGVGSFRTGFDDVEARLEAGHGEPRLTGRARVDSITITRPPSSAPTSSRARTSSTPATTPRSRSRRAASSSPTTAPSPSTVS